MALLEELPISEEPWKTRARMKTIVYAIVESVAKYVVAWWAVDSSETFHPFAFTSLLLNINLEMNYLVGPGGGYIDSFTNCVAMAKDLLRLQIGDKPLHTLDLINIVPGCPFLTLF